MDCNCEGYIGRVYRVISEAYPSTARSRIKSSCILFVGLIIVCYITGVVLPEACKKEMVRYLRSVQCPDGGWGL